MDACVESPTAWVVMEHYFRGSSAGVGAGFTIASFGRA